ncbi:hypothetical protein BDN67DRAFT_175973 [Paxillus ammoniavirescens]|nr:hypothetical protein BDN67DRAFT_175973 [Paxillus ammoniavirescens]
MKRSYRMSVALTIVSSPCPRRVHPPIRFCIPSSLPLHYFCSFFPLLSVSWCMPVYAARRWGWHNRIHGMWLVVDAWYPVACRRWGVGRGGVRASGLSGRRH